jgi:hypothetical protein
VAQLFSPSANAISRLSLVGLVLLLALVLGGMLLHPWTDYATGVSHMIDQPVPFSHEHHVAGLGIDCRFCHMHAQEAATAGMPTTQTCMTCHASVWTNAAALEPVRQSHQSGEPIAWSRVHDVPDFAYFNHAVHVNNGIGCVECHGHVERMPLMAKTATLHMRWCLDCHRHPDVHLRPVDQLYDTSPDAAPVDRRQTAALTQQYQLELEGLLSCSACHR